MADPNPWENAATTNRQAAAAAVSDVDVDVDVNDAGEPGWTRSSYSMNASNRRGRSQQQQQRQHQQDAMDAINTSNDDDPRPVSLIRLNRLLITLHVFDALLAISGIVYYSVFNKEDKRDKAVQRIWFFIWCGLLLKRFLAVIVSPSSKCGWMVSGYISMLLSMIYIISALMAICAKHDALHRTLYHLLQGFLFKTSSGDATNTLTANAKAISAICIGLSVWECVRWALVHKYLILDHQFRNEPLYSNFNHDIGQGLTDTPPRSSTNTSSSRRRPWWWNKTDFRDNGDAGMEHALLSDNDHNDNRGTTSSARAVNWFPFNRVPQNDRDDASVDFASLNEDWASRSEQDPVWWSHDGGGGGANGV